MRTESHPNNYSIKEHFPEPRLFKEFEGGELLLAEKDGLYYVIEDEGTLADFLMSGEGDGLVTIYEFDSEEEREQYIKKRGWGSEMNKDI